MELVVSGEVIGTTIGVVSENLPLTTHQQLAQRGCADPSCSVAPVVCAMVEASLMGIYKPTPGLYQLDTQVRSVQNGTVFNTLPDSKCQLGEIS
jgi:hypothetical protein